MTIAIELSDNLEAALISAAPAVAVTRKYESARNKCMEPEKNLPASIPPDLLAKAQAAVEQEYISVDESPKKTMERRLKYQEFEDVLAFGKRHAQQRGLRPSDVENAVDAVRDEEERRPQSCCPSPPIRISTSRR